MAGIEHPAVCGACGRQLPPQQGRGRRRRYCDATCRSAARRQRAGAPYRQPAGWSAPTDVKEGFAPARRHANLDATKSVADPVASTVRATAGRLAEELSRPGPGAPLAAVAAARELSAATDAALQAAVDRARAAGNSWKRIGDVLGTTRQAAFQRFGRRTRSP